MFDFSLGKLILLALIALLVLGPDKLPGAARTVGALVRRLRSGWDNVRAEVERELEIEEIRSAARQAAADAEATQAQASETLRQLQEEMARTRAEARQGVTDMHDEITDTHRTDADRAAPDAMIGGSDHGKG
ncbi:MAG TPA: Sec-independent protein translocase protein TatB [Oleiagrimonas sp.]|nr:Sec-independent protein translocase protein TatB [Oleiagrimonas sp.]